MSNKHILIHSALASRDYVADRVFSTGALLYSYFPGGYFDADGAPHYLHTDYQGSVVMVTDSAGTIEQHTSYYPYGEPHRSPAGQPILYGGKERLTTTDDYNYGARRHHAPAINWPTPDNKAPDYAWVSPYAFCLGNPVKFIDPDGNQPTPLEGAYIAQHVYEGKVGESLEGGWRMLKRYTSENSSSFKAGLYGRVDENGAISEYAFANAGTYMEFSKRGLSSIFENFTQVVGASTDMDESLAFAEDANDIAGDKELTFVGHSKGAAEAAGNALKFQKNALLYNPAAINAKGIGLDTSNYIGQKTTNGRQGITVYVVEGEFLDSLNKNILKAKTIDTCISIPHQNNKDKSFYRHKISHMIKDLINEGYK